MLLENAYKDLHDKNEIHDTPAEHSQSMHARDKQRMNKYLLLKIFIIAPQLR